jgi:hypothetical protein
VAEGVLGEGTTIGVHGVATGSGIALRGDNNGGTAGFFAGEVGITGDLNVSGEAGITGGLNVSGEVGITGGLNVSGEVGITADLNVNGNVSTLGDVRLVGADLAEQFTVEGDLSVWPGAVMVLAGSDCVRVSDTPYDPRVAGVVSGAGEFRPGIVLDRRDDQNRHPLALSGKVWCYADADEAPIRLGDLLTTSGTPGHAMRAADQARAFGAVIGKALAGLEAGRGLIPVLVALH